MFKADSVDRPGRSTRLEHQTLVEADQANGADSVDRRGSPEVVFIRRPFASSRRTSTTGSVDPKDRPKGLRNSPPRSLNSRSRDAASTERLGRIYRRPMRIVVQMTEPVDTTDPVGLQGRPESSRKNQQQTRDDSVHRTDSVNQQSSSTGQPVNQPSASDTALDTPDLGKRRGRSRNQRARDRAARKRQIYRTASVDRLGPRGGCSVDRPLAADDQPGSSHSVDRRGRSPNRPTEPQAFLTAAKCRAESVHRLGQVSVGFRNGPEPSSDTSTSPTAPVGRDLQGHRPPRSRSRSNFAHQPHTDHSVKVKVTGYPSVLDVGTGEERYRLAVRINDVPMDAIVDTGADVTVLANHMADRLHNCQWDRPANLLNFTGGFTEARGPETVHIASATRIVPVEAYSAHLLEDCILGNDALTALGVIIDCGARRVDLPESCL